MLINFDHETSRLLPLLLFLVDLVAERHFPVSVEKLITFSMMMTGTVI